MDTPAQTWVQVATLSGEGNLTSDVFQLDDAETRITYTVADTDILVGVIYLEPSPKRTRSPFLGRKGLLSLVSVAPIRYVGCVSRGYSHSPALIPNSTKTTNRQSR
jgi:hypothetical protein